MSALRRIKRLEHLWSDFPRKSRVIKIVEAVTNACLLHGLTQTVQCFYGGLHHRAC